MAIKIRMRDILRKARVKLPRPKPTIHIDKRPPRPFIKPERAFGIISPPKTTQAFILPIQRGLTPRGAVAQKPMKPKVLDKLKKKRKLIKPFKPKVKAKIKAKLKKPKMKTMPYIKGKTKPKMTTMPLKRKAKPRRILLKARGTPFG